MVDRVKGEILALVQVQDESDVLRLLAVCDTQRGPTVGVLAAPPNGAEGAVAFVPVPELLGLAVQVPELEVLLNEAARDLPSDPDDPRGLRAARAGRRPGMTS